MAPWSQFDWRPFPLVTKAEKMVAGIEEQQTTLATLTCTGETTTAALAGADEAEMLHTRRVGREALPAVEATMATGQAPSVRCGEAWRRVLDSLQ